MDYRPLPDNRKKQFQDYLQYAFSIEEGPQDEYDRDPDDRPGAPRALFDAPEPADSPGRRTESSEDGERMLCVCVHHWFRARLRGRQFEMPGLSAVASPPEHRRKGHVARLLAESLAEYRDRGDALTALWPFEHSFYERQGWGLANKYVRYECDPDALRFAREHASGEFRRVESDDAALLDPVLAADGEGYDLAIERTEEWWRERIFSGWETDPYVYAWEGDDRVRGYVVYRVTDEDDGKCLRVDELAAADREARLNCLRLLADHDSQVDRVRIYGPPDTALLDAADDPADVECEVRPGPMVRVVDVPTAFEALEYSGADDSEFTLAVGDPLAEWNDRTFRVAVEGGRATCEPTDSDPDATADVATLSQLYAGYHSVEDAETFGDFDVRNPDARETLDAMLPPREVFLREGF